MHSISSHRTDARRCRGSARDPRRLSKESAIPILTPRRNRESRKGATDASVQATAVDDRACPTMGRGLDLEKRERERLDSLTRIDVRGVNGRRVRLQPWRFKR